MQRIVINKCYGVFGISQKGIELYKALKGIDKKKEVNPYWDIKRNDPVLVKVVEILGEEASNWLSDLKIVDIPDGVEWTIEEHDGMEWVAEKHRTWC